MPAPLAHILNPIDVSPSQPTFQFLRREGQEISENTTSLVSYKRVPKACTHCRREKSRCDKTRPCDGCVRKGRVDSCVDGCVPCRLARLSCDQSRPCMSCVEYSLECIEDDTRAILPSRDKSKIQIPPPFRLSASPRRIKPHPRIDIPPPHTRSGRCCDACQRDNKKCPGGKACRHCAELGEQCTYTCPLKIIKQRCAQCRNKNKKCEHARPCVHCVNANTPCVDLPRKGVGRGKRVKRACVGCRADKIQCEEARPCRACKRKNVECVERACEACVAQGGKCGTCRRQELFYREEFETSSTASHSEEESLSCPFTKAPLARNGLLEEQQAVRPQVASSSHLDDQRFSMHAPAVPLSPRLNPPHGPPGFHVFYSYSSMHPAHPPVILPTPHTDRDVADLSQLPTISVGFSQPYLLSSTSHMRTRPRSDVSED